MLNGKSLGYQVSALAKTPQCLVSTRLYQCISKVVFGTSSQVVTSVLPLDLPLSGCSTRALIFSFKHLSATKIRLLAALCRYATL
jgi:hypothetical protein